MLSAFGPSVPFRGIADILDGLASGRWGYGTARLESYASSTSRRSPEALVRRLGLLLHQLAAIESTAPSTSLNSQESGFLMTGPGLFRAGGRSGVHPRHSPFAEGVPPRDPQVHFFDLECAMRSPAFLERILSTGRPAFAHWAAAQLFWRSLSWEGYSLNSGARRAGRGPHQDPEGSDPVEVKYTENPHFGGRPPRSTFHRPSSRLGQ